MSLLVADYGTSDSESEGEQSNSTSADPTDDTKPSSKRKFQLPLPNAISSNDKFSLPAANPSTSAALPMRNLPSTVEKSSRPVSLLARPKKVKGPVKIYLPSISDAESNEDENGVEEKSNCSKKLKKTAGGKSALFAMLPQPKNSSAPKVTAMMPASVAAKGKEKGKGKETETRNQTKVTTYRPQGGKREEDVDDTDQDFTDIARMSPFHEPTKQFPSAADEPSTASSSFFNRFRTEEGGQDGEDTLQGPSVPENAHNQNPYDQYYNGEQYPQEDPTYQQNWESYPDPQYYQQQEQPLETAVAEDVLDAETLAKLGGFRGRHRGPIHIQTVDVSQAIGPYNPIKNASAPTSTNESSYSHLKPSRMQKSKHNIMALAFQAKSMEDKLQESWSQSRKTKRQTQAKYGF